MENEGLEEIKTAGLIHHWVNPRFNGLPWPGSRKPKKKRACIRKSYSRQEAYREAEALSRGAWRYAWICKYCPICDACHVRRIRSK